jgi:hypothetical protein
VPDIWSIGPTAAAIGLRLRGFSYHEADRLVGVLQRDARGEFPGLTAAEKRRLLFVCWLVDRGRLGDGQRRGCVAPIRLAAVPSAASPAAPAFGVYERSRK